MDSLDRTFPLLSDEQKRPVCYPHCVVGHADTTTLLQRQRAADLEHCAAYLEAEAEKTAAVGTDGMFHCRVERQQALLRAAQSLRALGKEGHGG